MTLDELDDLERSVHIHGVIFKAEALDLIKAHRAALTFVGTLPTVPLYDETFGDDRLCACGHAYHRHFDSYDYMYPCGCKYCECHIWMQPTMEDV